VLAALEAVDLVVVFEQDTPLELIRRVRPKVLVKGGDYRREEVVGHEPRLCRLDTMDVRIALKRNAPRSLGSITALITLLTPLANIVAIIHGANPSPACSCRPSRISGLIRLAAQF
jgi:hypothetical protein